MHDELLQIKNKYGEDMMHYCRSNFATILEEPNKLIEILKNNFDYNKSLYNDLVNEDKLYDFTTYIFNIANTFKQTIVSEKSPYELLLQAGYELYECKKIDDLEKFKKYFRNDELLCTFFDYNRLNENYVFFAIKKNALDIKRGDNPNRQDEYGTSVISIQIDKKEKRHIFITNRYNHSVINPDATYSNNLDNIISGLTYSFNKYYDFKINSKESLKLEIPGYILANDGKYYKYNTVINNVYYCTNNYIIDNKEVITRYQDREKYLVIDYFIIDLVNKKIIIYDDKINDSFIDGFRDINKIYIKKDGKNKTIKIINGDEIRIIITNELNRIISYTDNYTKEVMDDFLKYNIYLEKLEMLNLKNIGDNFLEENIYLKEIFIPHTLSIANNFLQNNKFLTMIDISCCIDIKDNFLESNEILENINIDGLINVGSYFLYKNKSLSYLLAGKLKNIGSYFLYYNKKIYLVDLVNVLFIANDFMVNNISLKLLYVPNLKEIGNNSLYNNKILKKLVAPNLEKYGSNVLKNNSNFLGFSMELVYNDNIPRLKITYKFK